MATRIFHITDMANLRSICSDGGLRSLNGLKKSGTPYLSIAHDTVQDRRSTTPVPCGPGGKLHDYVPFYFAPRSPMLYAISRGRVPGYPHGQEGVVYLVSSAEVVRDRGCGFAFTDGHAIVAVTQFFEELHRLDQVDWKIMKARYWRDTDEDMDRKRRRQAEFLVYDFFPWELVEEVVVMRASQIAAVQSGITSGWMPAIKAQPSWYFSNA